VFLLTNTTICSIIIIVSNKIEPSDSNAAPTAFYLTLLKPNNTTNNRCKEAENPLGTILHRFSLKVKFLSISAIKSIFAIKYGE